MRSAKQRRRDYHLHGLRIQSEIPLRASQRANGPADVEVRWGAALAPSEVPMPAGTVVAELSLGEGRGYICVETETAYLLRFHGICDFRVDRALRSIRVHLAPGAHAGYVPLLLSGQVVALLLTLEGECVLHASAVRIGDSAVAFLGASGMGKSTLAALLCASGASLVTDDLLRVISDEDGLRCWHGNGELRLRIGAAFLTKCFPHAKLRSTVDGRVAIALRDRRQRPVKLQALVVPRLSRSVRQVQVKRLSLTQAFLSLNGYTTLPGLRAAEPLRSRFLRLANVAKRVPTYEAEVPWMPPLSPRVARQLLRAVGLIASREARA